MGSIQNMNLRYTLLFMNGYKTIDGNVLKMLGD